MKLYCDKCKSMNVENRLDEELPPEPEISMQDYAKGAREPISVNLVMVYHKHKISCKDCGHSIEYLA